jgi:hypothetical protein
MDKDDVESWREEKRRLEEAYRLEMEAMDLELIRTRAVLIRVVNILSGRDGEPDAAEAISVALEAIESAQRVIGRLPKSSMSDQE